MHIAENDAMHDSKEKVDDVMLAVKAFADMVSMIYHLMGRPDPTVSAVTSQWLAVMLYKLQEWGAISETQYEQVLHRIHAEAVEATEKVISSIMERAQPRDAEVSIDDGVKSLLERLGI